MSSTIWDMAKTVEATMSEAKAELAGKPSLVELAAESRNGSRIAVRRSRRLSARTATPVDLVIDASVAVEFLLGRRSTVDAVTAELSGALDEALHAPELIEPETLQPLSGGWSGAARSAVLTPSARSPSSMNCV